MTAVEENRADLPEEERMFERAVLAMARIQMAAGDLTVDQIISAMARALVDFADQQGVNPLMQVAEGVNQIVVHRGGGLG